VYLVNTLREFNVEGKCMGINGRFDPGGSSTVRAAGEIVESIGPIVVDDVTRAVGRLPLQYDESMIINRVQSMEWSATNGSGVQQI
jgi:hypothetical protein